MGVATPSSPREKRQKRGEKCGDATVFLKVASDRFTDHYRLTDFGVGRLHPHAFLHRYISLILREGLGLGGNFLLEDGARAVPLGKKGS